MPRIVRARHLSVVHTLCQARQRAESRRPATLSGWFLGSVLGRDNGVCNNEHGRAWWRRDRVAHSFKEPTESSVEPQSSPADPEIDRDVALATWRFTFAGHVPPREAV
jgi:hypothetical protein